MRSLGLRRERQGGDGARSTERGFTIVELLIALLVLAIILAALAPAFYGTLRAADLSDEHSQATGIALAASEQMRSFPYWQTGFTAADYQSGGVAYPCVAASSSPTVQVDTSDFDGLATTQSINNITYNIQRCAYWVNSSIGSATDPLAYKQLVVTVSWSMGQIHTSISQSSTLYPGGEGTYSGQENNYTPGSTTTTSAPATPSAPTWVSYATDPGTPSGEIDLVWTEPTNTPVAAAKYEVDYTTASNYGGSGYLTLTPGSYTPANFNTPGSASSPNVIDVAPSTTYDIEVWAIASDGTKSTAPSNVVSVTTSAATGGCTLSNLVVNPTTATVAANSKLNGFDSFGLSLNASGSCNTITVAYTETGSTVLQATMSGTGTLTGTAGAQGDKWDTGNHTFTAYLNGSAYSPPGGGAVQVQVDITQCKSC